jgi:hypothetical protein
MVTFGMLKRQNCDLMIGGYKPLPPMPTSLDDAEAYRQAMKLLRDDPQRVAKYVIPNTMGVSLMKDRDMGLESESRYLGVEYARIVDANPMYAEQSLQRLLSLAAPVIKEPKAMPAAKPIPPKKRDVPPQVDWLDSD